VPGAAILRSANLGRLGCGRTRRLGRLPNLPGTQVWDDTLFSAVDVFHGNNDPRGRHRNRSVDDDPCVDASVSPAVVGDRSAGRMDDKVVRDGWDSEIVSKAWLP
jgi:hypothetical protein